jgi:hypothetical protein
MRELYDSNYAIVHVKWIAVTKAHLRVEKATFAYREHWLYAEYSVTDSRQGMVNRSDWAWRIITTYGISVCYEFCYENDNISGSKTGVLN